MRIKSALAAILALFAVSCVEAQQFPPTPAHSVWGRIGIPGDTGPAQAIPFTTLQSQLAGTQAQNSVFAGPATGGSGLPTFRPLVAADVPPASAVPPIFNTGRPWCDITAQGAVGGNKALDTTGFVTCLALLNSTYGGGIINIPPTPSGSCFFFGAINATGINNITVKGAGSTSCIVINGKDTANVWFDLSGSNDWKFEDISIKSDGSTIPNVAILWACTGASCGSSGVLTGLTFNNVGISAATTQAVFYGYGFGNVSTPGAHGSLSINNSSWVQTNNGAAAAATPSNRNSVVHITATNDLSVTSANRTIATSAVYSWGAVFNNVYLWDQPGGFVAPNDNNAALILHNVSNFLMNGGALLCLCDSDLVITSNMQGSQFNQVQFLGAGGGNPNYWIFIGEGLNTFMTFNAPFFSTPTIAVVQLGPPVGALGGVWYLNMFAINAAGNPGSLGFIYTGATCTGFAGTSFWIRDSYFQMYPTGSGTSVITCGSIDSHTIFTNTVAVTLQGGGATDSSHKF
jgi:hypothetical protein